MRGLVCVAIVLLAFACNGDGETPRTATPAPSPSATPAATATPAPSPSATPQATATATATPSVSPGAALEIAYVGSGEEDVWLMAADGSGKRNLTEGRCAHASRLYWSPRGDRIACIRTVYADPPEAQVLLFDLEGQVLLEIEHQALFAGYWGGSMGSLYPSSLWSPSGRTLAYVVEENLPARQEREPPLHGTPVLVIADARQGILTSIAGGQQPHWSADGERLAYNRPPGQTLSVYEVTSGEEYALGEGLLPLAWVLGDKALLVAAHFQPPEDFQIPMGFEANLLDLASGQMTRVPDLDPPRDFWLSPAAGAAAVFNPAARGYRLAILNLSDLQSTPIARSVIGYPSDFIPQNQVAFSPDGSEVYWADRGSAPETIYKANRDGSGLTKVLELPGWFGGFSPDLTRVLYWIHRRLEAGNGWANELWVANIDGSDARLLAEEVSWAAWRPAPTP